MDILSEDGGGDGTDDERDNGATSGHHRRTASGRSGSRAGLSALEASAGAARRGGASGGGRRGSHGGAGESWVRHGGALCKERQRLGPACERNAEEGRVRQRRRGSESTEEQEATGLLSIRAGQRREKAVRRRPVLLPHSIRSVP